MVTFSPSSKQLDVVYGELWPELDQITADELHVAITDSGFECTRGGKSFSESEIAGSAVI